MRVCFVYAHSIPQRTLFCLGAQGFRCYLAAVCKFGDPSELHELNKKPIEVQAEVAMQTCVNIFAAIVDGRITRDMAEVLLHGMLDENNGWPTQVTTADNGESYFFGFEEDRKCAKIMVAIIFAVLSRVKILQS